MLTKPEYSERSICICGSTFSMLNLMFDIYQMPVTIKL